MPPKRQRPLHHPSQTMPLQQRCRRALSALVKAVMRSYRIRLPMFINLPIRFRPYFLAFAAIIMVILALLSFSLREWPINDKVLHFLLLGIATGVFYFIFDVDEDARRVWIWRNLGLLITCFTCVLVGGIFSEVIQSYFPFQPFDWGHIFANSLGGLTGLAISYNLERYYRHRREISRLYRPLDSSYSDEQESDEDELLTSYDLGATIFKADHRQSRRLGNVWDSREALFEIGDEEHDEDIDEGPRKVPSSNPRISVMEVP